MFTNKWVFINSYRLQKVKWAEHLFWKGSFLPGGATGHLIEILREGVQKKHIFLELCPKQQNPPTHPYS